MRGRVFVSVLMAVILLSGVAYAEDYSRAEGNDYGVYLYFNRMLSDFNSIVEGIVNGENGTVTKAESFYSIANVTAEEAVRYGSLGIQPSAVKLAYYFKGLGEAAFTLSSSHQKFLERLENGDFVGARTNLILMKSSMDDIYSLLGRISGISLTGENGESLSFDLSETYGPLEELARLIERYEENLNRLAAPEEFSIFASKESPFLYENVTFYGYTLGLEDVRVVINNVPYQPEIIDGGFRFRYSFDKTGLYEVYAQAVNGSRLVTSNVILVEVQKIPTRIIATEKTGVKVSVEGHLLDYFGNALPGKMVFIEIDGRSYASFTDGNGTFTFELGELPEEKNATIFFPGDREYNGAVTRLTLLPPKPRLTIRLFFEGEAREGEEVRIPGYVNGTSETIPLEVYVDDEPTETIYAGGNFTLSLRFGKGKHTVYVRFPGNERFAESVSNVVEVQAVPYNYLWRLLIFAGLLILGFAGYRLLTRRPKALAAEKEPEEKREGEGVEVGEGKPDVVRSYRFLYGFLRRLYSLPKSITPRELLGRFKGESFFPELKRATILHEVAFYGKKKLGAREVIDGVRSVATAIVKAFVREEL
ncbi:MAG TPA: Ig-like domain repeat protein [Thermococcus sp.]|nr:Ig-like domain repeat protein [Thermococcus sp.]